ncbi:Starch-binding associating with outer membrane [Chryseobacterium taeanense]|uniref:Starch-binding associating with outer membrane n=1 Tax=Chryseobacterium taeanense TaxID=311334 RepID=A0A1G8DMD0_9FLAO|nr:SusD/RagB family nutrient-binding outer membrane lipoprotein [Chryseobacterium taeanense]SDH58772.1 Starch-binding associating with outer membrane [Chryseobacterium taeanense]
MKKIFKYISLLSIGVSILACNNFDELNTDPNSAYTTKPDALLSYAQKQLADYLNTPSVNENNFRLTMQYWQEVTYVDESNYDFVTRNISNNVWLDLYVDTMQNLVKAKSIINEYVPTATEQSTWPVTKANQLAILDIQQVFIYQTLVDTYGDIPYNESNSIESTSLPKYEKAADIYTDLISRLKNDLSKLDPSGSGFENPNDPDRSGDIFYKGNVAKWQTFGNSLLLKLAIGIADHNPSLAQSTATLAIGNGVMTSSADDCLFRYLSSSPNFNPLYENLVASNRNDFVAGKTLVDYMNASSDPRRAAYFDENVTPYKGGTIGTPSSFAVNSHIGDFAYTQTTPGVIMNYTEVAFYLAEASARWGIGVAPALAYANAVNTSLSEWGVSTTDATAYLAANPYNATNWKKSIGEQAWVAMFNQGMVSWNFYRRLDFPVLSAPSTAVSQAEGKVPVRLQYPVRETTTNPTNYAAAAASIGGDKLTTKIFWDKF